MKHTTLPKLKLTVLIDILFKMVQLDALSDHLVPGNMRPFELTLGDNGYVIDNRRPIGYPKILLIADKNRYKVIDTDNDTSPISITITNNSPNVSL